MAAIRQGGPRIVAGKRLFAVLLAVLFWLGPKCSGAHPAEVARPMGGYVAGRNTDLKPAAFQNWAEFYADGRWHLTDPHGGICDDQSGHSVATRVLGDSDTSLENIRVSALRARASRWS